MTEKELAEQLNHVWAMLKTTQDELTKVRCEIIELRVKLQMIAEVLKK